MAAVNVRFIFVCSGLYGIEAYLEVKTVIFFKKINNLLFGSAEYLKHFTAGFDGVHAFAYNSVESEPIWVESVAFSRG